MNLIQEYILLSIILIITSLIYNKLALLFNIVDIPNNRSSHGKVTIRGGGIIFPLSLFYWFLYSGFPLPWFFLGLLLISIISFWDDISNISPKFRLIAQLISLLILFLQVGFYQLPWWYLIFILIISTGVINAFNFMDGINGITSSYSLSVLVGLWFVNNYSIQFIDNEFIYCVIIALIIFSFFNFRKRAICFAGDIGSISIAYVVIFLISKLIFSTGNFIYLLFVSVYGIDTIYTIIYRILNKEDIFTAHRKHLYQLLVNELNISHLKVATIYSLIQLIICLFVYKLSKNSYNPFNSIYIVAIFMLFMGLTVHIIRTQFCNKPIKI